MHFKEQCLPPKSMGVGWGNNSETILELMDCPSLTLSAQPEVDIPVSVAKVELRILFSLAVQGRKLIFHFLSPISNLSRKREGGSRGTPSAEVTEKLENNSKNRKTERVRFQ